MIFGILSLTAAAERPPNIVIIFLDDAGWSDFEPFGDPPYQTPHVERLAREGMRFDNVYVPQAVCSASRASLLSGTFPARHRVFGAHAPFGRGLEPTIPILPELLQPLGYATAHFGKWHLGDQPDTRPLARGFDEHAGLMYSNDMWRHHPGDPEFWGQHPLQYWDNGTVTLADVTKDDQKNLTRWSAEQSVDFIERHADQPFLLYVAPSMPHVPLFCSDEFLGKSGVGLYGDVILELDWMVGQITDALECHDLANDTIVIFSSDNGPWEAYGTHAGRTPFRGAKRTGFDGGLRSAFIVRYPETVPANSRSTTLFSTADVVPTLLAQVDDRERAGFFDGADVWPIWTNDPGARSPLEYYPFSTGDVFQGIITGDGRWKLHLPHEYRYVTVPGRDGQPGRSIKRMIEASLFDLVQDPNETTNVIDQYPEVASRLQGLADSHANWFYGRTGKP